jgi:circadian clock protein KaiC
MFLVEGDPGAGKTTLGLQFLRAGAATGESSAYVALADTEHEVRRLAASHGWPLDGVDLIQGGGRPGSLEQDYSLYHPAEVELDQISKSIFAMLDRHQPARVVLDSLSELRLLAQDPLRYRRHLLALKDYFHRHSITAVLIDFPSMGSDRHLESLCHGILTLDQLSPEYGGQRRRLRVRKLRESEFRDGYHDFTIRPGGLEVYPRLVSAHLSPRGRRRDLLPSGCQELDSLLGGGLDRGTSTLIMGPAAHRPGGGTRSWRPGLIRSPPMCWRARAMAA